MALTAPSCELGGRFVRAALSSIKKTRVRRVPHLYQFKNAQETRPRSASFLSSARSPPW